jgi:hypothetical protein
MKRLIFILGLLAAPAFGQYTIGQWTAATAGMGGSSTAATPTFSPAAGTYTSTQTVTISTATSLAVLCYTTDGTTPTESANLCSGGTTSTYATPITVSTTQTVKAIATLALYTDSAVGSALYTISASTPSPVGTPVCNQSGGSAFNITYTPVSAGDGLMVCWAAYSTTETLSSVTDGGSSYTVVSGLTGQHGTARSVQEAYTTNLRSGVTSITITGSITTAPHAACVQEFSNVSGVGNTVGSGPTGTGTYSVTATRANTTDYAFLCGVGSASATTVTPTNGGVAPTGGNVNVAGDYFLWLQYNSTSAVLSGSINYAGGNMGLAWADVQ